MQEALQIVPLHNILNEPLESRLEWLKLRQGWINYNFTETLASATRISIKVYFCNVTNSTEGVEV